MATQTKAKARSNNKANKEKTMNSIQKFIIEPMQSDSNQINKDSVTDNAGNFAAATNSNTVYPSAYNNFDVYRYLEDIPEFQKIISASDNPLRTRIATYIYIDIANWFDLFENQFHKQIVSNNIKLVENSSLSDETTNNLKRTGKKLLALGDSIIYRANMFYYLFESHQKFEKLNCHTDYNDECSVSDIACDINTICMDIDMAKSDIMCLGYKYEDVFYAIEIAEKYRDYSESCLADYVPA